MRHFAGELLDEPATFTRLPATRASTQRYTCPSYEIVRLADSVRIAVPGFQPFGVHDVITANLVPESERRDPPDSVDEVLAWAATPLATHEVAVAVV